MNTTPDVTVIVPKAFLDPLVKVLLREYDEKRAEIVKRIKDILDKAVGVAYLVDLSHDPDQKTFEEAFANIVTYGIAVVPKGKRELPVKEIDLRVNVSDIMELTHKLRDLQDEQREYIKRVLANENN